MEGDCNEDSMIENVGSMGAGDGMLDLQLLAKIAKGGEEAV